MLWTRAIFMLNIPRDFEKRRAPAAFELRIRGVSHALPVRNIAEHFLEFVPESQFLDFPGVAVQVPNAAFMKGFVEERPAFIYPSGEMPKVRAVPDEFRQVFSS